MTITEYTRRLLTLRSQMIYGQITRQQYESAKLALLEALT